jgi:multidrug transporter EmrE-like cation transporter
MEDPMSEHRFGAVAFPQGANISGIVVALVALNLIFSILANAAFRISAQSASWREVVSWQVVGNLAGFITVIALTVLLRYTPLSVAFPVTTGINILGVQIVAARWLFAEPIGSKQWVGSLLICAGVFLAQR